MAAGKRGAGPGAYTENGVNCTMGAPFNKAMGAGRSGGAGENKAPFNKPQSMGNGTIPTKFFDTSMAARSATTVQAGNVSPGVKGQPAIGNRRFRNPK